MILTGVQISSTLLLLNNANIMFEEDSGINTLSLTQITLQTSAGSSYLEPFGNYLEVLLFGSPVDGTSQNRIAPTLVDTSANNHFIELLPGIVGTFF